MIVEGLTSSRRDIFGLDTEHLLVAGLNGLTVEFSKMLALHVHVRVAAQR